MPRRTRRRAKKPPPSPDATPSTAAELVVERKDEIASRIQRSEDTLRALLRAGVEPVKDRVRATERMIGAAIPRQKVEGFEPDFDEKPERCATWFPAGDQRG